MIDFGLHLQHFLTITGNTAVFVSKVIIFGLRRAMAINNIAGHVRFATHTFSVSLEFALAVIENCLREQLLDDVLLIKLDSTKG